MRFLFASLLMFLTQASSAEDIAAVRGIVHDPQHRPLAGASVTLRSASFSKTATSNAGGEFQIDAVPEGSYAIEVSAPGFRSAEQQISVSSSRNPVLHFQLELAAVTSQVEVSESISRLAARRTISIAILLRSTRPRPAACRSA